MAPKDDKHDAASPQSASTSAVSHSSTPEIFSLRSLLQQQPAEPDWVIPDLLPVGVSLLAGPPQVDKALLANQLGLSVANGTPFLEHFPARQGHVLYLALSEGMMSVRSRTTRLLREQEYPEAFDLALHWSPFRQHGLADLEDTLARLVNPLLVIVDPLEYVLPLHTGQPAQNYRVRHMNAPLQDLHFLIPLRELATYYHLSILLLHHLPDDWPANRRDPLAGMSPNGLTAASACNLVLMPAREPEICTLHIAGFNMEELRLSLTLDTRLGQWRHVAN